MYEPKTIIVLILMQKLLCIGFIQPCFTFYIEIQVNTKVDNIPFCKL